MSKKISSRNELPMLEHKPFHLCTGLLLCRWKRELHRGKDVIDNSYLRSSDSLSMLNLFTLYSFTGNGEDTNIAILLKRYQNN